MRMALAAVLAGVLSVAAATAGGTPTVRLVQAFPVVVAGTGFPARTPVVVRYRSGATSASRAVRSSAAGTFRATLGRVAFDRCKGAVVTAGAARLAVRPCTARGGRPELHGDLQGAVSGSAFVPGEQVSVTGRASGGSTAGKTVVADATGAFRLQLSLKKPRCAELFYIAQGALGSRATYATPAPACIGP